MAKLDAFIDNMQHNKPIIPTSTRCACFVGILGRYVQKGNSMRTILFLTFISFNVSADNFFELPELSSGCKLEVENYESKVKADVQDYLSGITTSHVKDLFDLRKSAISENSFEIQKLVDSKIALTLNRLMNKSHIPDRDIAILGAVKEELLTNPLAVSAELNSDVLEKFTALGL
jgi:hypothetical protein